MAERVVRAVGCRDGFYMNGTVDKSCVGDAVRERVEVWIAWDI